MKKIDVHAHLGWWPWCPRAEDAVAHLLSSCEKEDIICAICSSALAIQYDMQEGNAELAEAVAKHERLLGYVYANANWVDESVAQMERYLPLAGFVGVKIHPRFSGVPENAPEMAELIAQVARRSRVLLMHTVDQNAARQMGRYAEQYPDLAIILAHCGHTDSDEAARVAAQHPNVYLDFCCEWPGAGKIERAIEICGPKKIMFGSDADLLEPAFTRGMFEGARLTEAQQRMVYYENAARLFGLPGGDW